MERTNQDRMDEIAFHATNHLERLQILLNTFISSANQRASFLFSEASDWIDNLDLRGRAEATWSSAIATRNDLLNIIRNLGVHAHLSPYITNIKAFFENEVSKQAIYFGCAGLVTGGFIGLCIGYTVKQNNSLSSQYFSSPLNNGTPSLMKALFCSTSRRGIDGITLATVPVPRNLSPTEVLVQVKAVGLDNIDVRIACGYAHALRRHLGLPSVNEPFLLGRECSGIVLETGAEVRSVETNDKIWASLPLYYSPGLCSEYVVLPSSSLCLKPRNVSFEAAATLPYAATILWKNILPLSGLSSSNTRSKRVLIHLGVRSKNDGVGLLATQVLKSWGARVTISTEETGGESEEDVAQMTFLHTLKSLGAESHIILPHEPQLLQDLAQRIFDVVVNTDSQHVTPYLENFLRDSSGSVIETFPSELRRKSSWTFSHFIESIYNLLFSKKEDDEGCVWSLEECRRLIESGFVVPVLSRSFLVSQYDQAFRHVSNSSNSALAHAHVGKSVLIFKSHPSPS